MPTSTKLQVYMVIVINKWWKISFYLAAILLWCFKVVSYGQLRYARDMCIWKDFFPESVWWMKMFTYSSYYILYVFSWGMISKTDVRSQTQTTWIKSKEILMCLLWCILDKIIIKEILLFNQVHMAIACYYTFSKFKA